MGATDMNAFTGFQTLALGWRGGRARRAALRLGREKENDKEERERVGTGWRGSVECMS